ncbi:MAG: hypothetical protein VKK59_01805, partial [Vampirovibrionales bacterium]|nr:hypothetical protein [Vampirovibrionales bacterium]
MLSFFLGGHHTLGWADETTSDTLNQLERQVFGAIVAPAGDEASRVARLEETVFGQLSSEPIAQRISRLCDAVPIETAAISRPPT